MCILQDQQGFLWLGTNDGLYRYDGYTFKAYRHDPNDANTLSNNNIRALYEDEMGKLWIGTYGGGINVLDQDRNTFTHYYHDPEDYTSLSFDEIMVFFEDRQGRLWIGTDGGGVNQYLWEENAFVRFQHRQDDTSSLSHNNVLSLFEDSEGYLWAGTWYGLNRMDTQTGECLRFYHDPADPQTLSSNDIWSIYEIAPYQFWIGLSDGGVDVLNTQTGKVNRTPFQTEAADASEMVRVLRKHNERKVWVGGSAGLLMADPRNQTMITHFQNAATAERDAVLSLEENKTGMVWVGTTNGLYKLDPNNKDFHFHQFFPSESAANLSSSLYQDTTGVFWVGTPQGLIRYVPTTGQQQLFVPEGNANVQAFYAGNRGFFWIGTPEGLYRFYPRQQKFEPFVSEKFQSVSSRNIREIHEDSNGRVWVGTILGLNKITFTEEGPQVVRYENDPHDPHSLVYSHHTSVVLEDREGTLWIGTNGGGISRFDPEQEKFTRYLYEVDDPESLSNNFVECMYEDAGGTLWIGTRAGLNKLDKNTGKFQRYTTANGLDNYWINTILGDEEGNLWLSTRGGISMFDPQQQNFNNYDMGDGLISDVFISKAGWEGRNGTLYFGSNRGMMSFHPDSIHKNAQIPPVILTEFSLFNHPVTPGENSPLQKDISRTDSIELTYRQSSFSFEYVALNYTNSKKNQYAYQLQGFDSDWNFVGNGRIATYTNVKPGNYVFRVKASNNEGVWNEVGTSVYITVLPPFWQTTWAYGVYVLLVLAMLYGLYRYFLNRERSKSQLAMERLQMTQAHELNQLKIRFFTHVSHEIRTPLTLILSPIEKMLASAKKNEMPWKKQVELVHRNALRLQNLVNQLMDFRKIESGNLQLEPAHGDLVVFVRNVFDAFAHLAAERQMRYRFFSSKDKIWASFDADKLEKILNNLLSNALKYTPEGGDITLEIRTEEQNNGTSMPRAEPVAIIQVKDSGIGIPEEEVPHIFDPFYQAKQTNPYKQASSGIGLALTRELVKLHRGNITLQSQAGNGTTVTVELPLMQTGTGTHATQNVVFATPENTNTDEALAEVDSKKEPSSEETSQPLLLVVDDNPDIRQFILENFSDQYRILEAENGKIALKEAMHHVPDVVISDVLMPVMDGITFCKKLRARENTSHVPVILLTASHSETNRLRALSIGADDYIHKPFNIFLLKARVQNLLEMRQQLRKRFSREVRLQPRDVTVSDVDEKLLQRLMDLVEAYMGDPDFNVEVMCKKIGISRPQLYRKLQALTGQSVHEFIRTVRLKRAAQLLETGQLPIAEVAYRVGFNDPQYFSRCFKKQFGISPSKVSV